MKKLLPIIFLVASLAVLYFNIIKQEIIIHSAQSIYIKLQPVDPRSLIQGDYMQLAYTLNIKDPEHIDKTKNYQHITLKVKLNPERIVEESLIDFNQVEQNEALLKVKSNNSGQTFFPATESFLFAEGLEYCYQNAAYAEFKVTAKGSAVLKSLVDAQLASLDCEAKGREFNATK